MNLALNYASQMIARAEVGMPAVKPAPASPPAPTELQAFLVGLDALDIGLTAYACFTVRELAALVGISERDVIDRLRTEADYWLDGMQRSHAALIAELHKPGRDGRSGDVECNVFRRERWQLALAVALNIVSEEAVA